MRKRWRIRAGGLLLACCLLNGCSGAGPPATESVAKPASAPPIQSEVISASPDVRKITFHSESLGKDMKFNIYLPPGYNAKTKYPVLYALHGYARNEDSWLPGMEADKTADRLVKEGRIEPLIIVSPAVDNSYGFNSSDQPAKKPCADCADEGRYGDYLTKDLIAYVDAHFSTAADRSRRFIGGISMGGWAALHNSFLHPELYSKAGGHSAALYMEEWFNTGGLRHWMYPIPEMRDWRDPLLLADTEKLEGLSVYLDCGEQDNYKFYEGSELLYRKLKARNIDVQYHLSSGGHDKNYWMPKMENYLLFYAGK
ncbi:alpha/beta hydrolase [Paenibacillus caseinilyticus]|uniref:Esterase n=1 Tax=Paenibacillus mucilaginosus K02 TaxID=997761 RepID=I0BP17_9BACL|nr:alpha/beta hydrolase-fold protein [Paenibacillus mucilaginosus]AFH64114.1 esterase [Paenibacillus mucilaginosus K02]